MELQLFDDIIMDNSLISDSFIEGCEALEETGFFLDSILYKEEFFIEARARNTAGDKFDSAMKNTVQTTKDVAKVYGDATDAGGIVIKGAWDVSVTSVGLVAKILKFISTGIGKILTMIKNVLKWVGNIPGNVVNKIRGNIELYVTAPDLEFFYNKVFPDVEDFLGLAHAMSQGDVWSSFMKSDMTLGQVFKLIGQIPLTKAGLMKNDMGLYKSMKAIERNLQKVQFELSTIELSKPEVRNVYFGDEKSINFYDVTGTHHQHNFYDALNHLFERMSTGHDGSKEASVYERLRNTQQALADKFNASQKNNTFAQLTKEGQLRVKDSILMMSRVAMVLGNLFKYVMHDLNTIKKAASSVLQKQGMIPATSAPGKGKKADRAEKLPKS